MSRVLFIHQNYPSQFRRLAPELSRRGWNVKALVNKAGQPRQDIAGVDVIPYSVKRSSTPGIHPWLIDFETKVIRAEACFHALRSLLAEGFVPDLVIAHHGWGESLFVKRVWPKVKVAIYCEFYYLSNGGDSAFDPEFPVDLDELACKLEIKNINNDMHFRFADAGIAPTKWQASSFPEPFRSRITVIHDGINTIRVSPNEAASLTLSTSLGHSVELTRKSEVITFVNRNLEPLRGFHIFMRALPYLLAQRPACRVLIVGGSEISYGVAPDGGGTWKERLVSEIRSSISDADWARVHFVGNVGYNEFVTLLQVSTVHVYLTYPFVLGWSLLEAMSAQCAIVASDTPPLQEVIRHNESGILVDFFDPHALALAVIDLLQSPHTRDRLGKAARRHAVENYDLETVCLPKQLKWVDSLLGKKAKNTPQKRA